MRPARLTVGLIGFGRLGKLLVRFFARDYRILVFDAKPQPRAVRALGARPADLSEVCAQDIVIPCVPIKAFEALIKRIAPLLRPGALVIDVCSVKEHPVRVMRRWLPKDVGILGTHPNFGPDSASESLRGQKLIVCKVRISASLYRRAMGAWRRKGLSIIEMSPAAHDRKAAASLALTHFIGRSLIAFGAKSTGVDTEGYKRLLRILQTVQNDSWRLFEDMNRFNAYAPAMRRRFLRSLRAIDARVGR